MRTPLDLLEIILQACILVARRPQLWWHGLWAAVLTGFYLLFFIATTGSMAPFMTQQGSAPFYSVKTNFGWWFLPTNPPSNWRDPWVTVLTIKHIRGNINYFSLPYGGVEPQFEYAGQDTDSRLALTSHYFVLPEETAEYILTHQWLFGRTLQQQLRYIAILVAIIYLPLWWWSLKRRAYLILAISDFYHDRHLNWAELPTLGSHLVTRMAWLEFWVVGVPTLILYILNLTDWTYSRDFLFYWLGLGLVLNTLGQQALVLNPTLPIRQAFYRACRFILPYFIQLVGLIMITLVLYVIALLVLPSHIPLDLGFLALLHWEPIKNAFMGLIIESAVGQMAPLYQLLILALLAHFVALAVAVWAFWVRAWHTAAFTLLYLRAVEELDIWIYPDVPTGEPITPKQKVPS